MRSRRWEPWENEQVRWHGASMAGRLALALALGRSLSAVTSQARKLGAHAGPCRQRQEPPGHEERIALYAERAKKRLPLGRETRIRSGLVRAGGADDDVR